MGFHGNEWQLKTRVGTMLAHTALENILRTAVEPMPHLSYNGGKGIDHMEYRLPASIDKVAIWGELNGLWRVRISHQLGTQRFTTLGTITLPTIKSTNRVHFPNMTSVLDIENYCKGREGSPNVRKL